jgi:hypothetical protein
MKKIRVYIFLILFMTPLFAVASVVNNIKIINYPVYVTEIAQKVGDLTASPDIWISDKFHYLFKNINLYIQDSLEVLSSDKLTDLEKHVVILAVQGLDLDNRILFAEKLTELLEKGKISHRIFRKTLFIEYGWNTLFQEHFQQKKVQNLLRRIRNSESVETELKRYKNQCRIIYLRPTKNLNQYMPPIKTGWRNNRFHFPCSKKTPKYL